MVWIPGGIFWMGSESDKFPDARPIHKVYVDGFWMGRTEVTNAQFRRFVEASGYVTVAEKAPDLAEIMKQIPPGTPPPAKRLCSRLFGLYRAGRHVPLNDVSQWWKWTPGADWRHPEGPGSTLEGRDHHPVVHVAYSDALAYCAWRGKQEGGVYRLPTEAEWEFASRGGLDKKPYLWGDELRPNGKPMANTWQGEFPHKNTMEDGYLGTAPVGPFPANGFGLHDMAGNVWEWCSDWYQPRYAIALGERNPQGPTAATTPMSRTCPNASSGAARFCAATITARATWPGPRQGRAGEHDQPYRVSVCESGHSTQLTRNFNWRIHHEEAEIVRPGDWRRRRLGDGRRLGELPAQPESGKPALGKGKRAQEFVAAFNRGDAKAVAGFWAPDAEYVDQMGGTVKGRAALEKLYAKTFAENKVRSWPSPSCPPGCCHRR